MKTILIVDDLESVRFYHQHLLGQAGFRTLTADDGEAALAALDANAVDLVVLDLVMPRMSGTEFLARARASRRNDGLPVLIITSEALQEPAGAEPARGPTTILQKPVSSAVLLTAVQRLID